MMGTVYSIARSTEFVVNDLNEFKQGLKVNDS